MILDAVSFLDRERKSTLRTSFNGIARLLLPPTQQSKALTEFLRIPKNLAPRCLRCRTISARAGKDRRGISRWQCRNCKVKYRGTGESGPAQYEQACNLFRQGHSVRAIGRALNISRATAWRYRQTALAFR